MPSEPGLRVGLDACVLVRGILFALLEPHQHCVLILQQAAARRFVVIPSARVEEEVRRALASAQIEGALDSLLTRCDYVRTPRASDELLLEHERPIRECVGGHLPDARIGVEIKCFTPQAHYFVSDNPGDWRPTLKLQAALGGVEVMRPKTFLRRIGALPG